MPTTAASNVRLNSRLLPALVAILLVLQLFDPSRIWITLLVGLVAGWLVSYLWATSLARSLQLQREMRYGWAQVGDRLEERFTLINRGWLPGLWVELIDHSTIPGYRPGRVTGVGGSGENGWRTHGVCAQRGLYTLGPTSLQTGDPLGFYTVQLHNPASATLVVMPPIVPLPSIEVAPGGRAGEGRPRPNAPERTVSVSTVRAYAPGDSLRWIHWRTSARREQLHVRIFDSTPSSDWWILLDMDQRTQVGEGQSSTEEHSVILAASLADRGLRLGRAVGLVAHGNELVWLPPREGHERRWEVLRALALLHPGPTSLGELLVGTRASLGQRASLVIITANLDSHWLEALLPLVWRGVVPTVLLLDPVSFGGEGNQQPLLTLLSEWNIPHYPITADLLDRPEAHPGQAGQWEWRVLPTGRAIPVRRPANLDWKVLA